MTRRVVRILPSLEKVGPVQGTLNTLRKMDRSRYETTVMVLADEAWGHYIQDAPSLRDEYLANDIPLVELKLPKPWDVLVGSGRIRRALEELAPDLVHTQLLRPHIYGRTAAHKLGLPLVSTIHNENQWLVGTSLSDRLKTSFDNRTARYVDRFVAVSPAVKDFVMAHQGIAEDKISVIHNGVPMDRFDIPDTRAQVRNAHHIGEGEIAVGTVARIDDQKNPTMLVDVAESVVKQHDFVRFFWIGDGPLMEETKAEVERRGLGERVTFLGQQEDVLPLLQMLDIFILTSRYEGLSNALLEAMAMGLPAVATKVSGNAVTIEDAVSGVLTPEGDAEMMARAVSQLATDASRRQSVGKAARERIASSFSSTSVAEAYARVYDAVLAR